jgi:hypothetical protein
MSKATSEAAAKQALAAMERWFSGLAKYADQFPAKGTIAGALVVLEHLKEHYDLKLESHTARGGSQIRGASGAAVKKILAAHGEHRRFVSEGGRTNRGLRGDVKTLLAALGTASLESLPLPERRIVLGELQAFLTKKVTFLFEMRRIDCKYTPQLSAYQFISSILEAARKRGKEGSVAEYLVGAKLQLRFPGLSIENKCASTADAPHKKHGDFCVGDTIFHVTVSPNEGHLEKCKRNLEENLRPWLLIPESMGYYRVQVERKLNGPYALSGIETFVAQNIAELAEFSGDLLPAQLLRLLELYNERVAAVESDQSMLIDVPPALARLSAKQH